MTALLLLLVAGNAFDQAVDQDLAISVMPRYRGRGPDGPIVDERPTLIIMDRKKRSWPLMAKMDEPAARDLLKQLLQVK